MIRRVEPRDIAAITHIYNEYILHSVITFETEPLREEEMGVRITDIAAHFPCFVDESDGEIRGYCYAHLWKEKAAYKHTLETTIYLSPEHTGKGIGRRLMETLIDACRKDGHQALVACVTEGNAASDALHLGLGFQKVSHFEKVGQKFGRLLDVIDYELLL